MGVIHALLAGKGGSGKSYFSAALAQYLAERGRPATCFDIDPVNATLAGFSGLDVQCFDIRRDDDIDRAAFDVLIDAMCDAADTGAVILDAGVSTFVPLVAYLDKYKVVAAVARRGHSIVFHGVVIGGQSVSFALQALTILLSNEGFQSSPVVAWINPFFGPVTKNGVPFEELNTYKNYIERYAGIVHVPEVDDLEALDVRSMLAASETFEAAVNDRARIMMVRQRLQLLGRELFAAMDAAGLADMDQVVLPSADEREGNPE